VPTVPFPTSPASSPRPGRGRPAERGDVELARTLLRLGADPDLRDKQFDSTALGWARFFGQEPLVELLEPVTAPAAAGPAAAGPAGG